MIFLIFASFPKATGAVSPQRATEQVAPQRAATNKQIHPTAAGRTSNRKTAVTDPLGNTTRYVYSTTGTLQNVIAADDSWTTCTYDTWDRLTTFTDQLGNSTGYTYDLLGRKLTETNPLNQTTTYVYNDSGCASCGSGAGQLHSVTDPGNRTTYYEYDDDGRVKKITYSGSTDYVEFGYDALGRRITMLDTRLPAADLGSQTFAWAYDIADRVTSETYPDGNSIRYGFDLLGRRVTMTDPGGNVTTYTYANTATNKKLQYIDHPFAGRTSYYYDSKGRLWEEDYSTGVFNTWQYDSLNRVSAIAASTPYEELITEEAYTYNANSMRTRIEFWSDVRDDFHKLYSYDRVLRLTEEHERAAFNNASLYRYAYTYDGAGNRKQMLHFDGTSTSTTNYEYNAGNQLTGYGDPDLGLYPLNACDYDSNGNMIEDYDQGSYEGKEYHHHNRENRLTSVWPYMGEDPLVEYTYDALGRRILRTDSDGNKLLYYYDGLSILMVKEQPSGCSSWRTKNAYALKQAAIGQIISEREYTYSGCSGTPSWCYDIWYHFDLLGNTTCLTGYGGGIADMFDMEAFGTVVSGAEQGFHLTTKQSDTCGGIYYFGARWYEPGTGRFLEADPVMSDVNASLYNVLPKDYATAIFLPQFTNRYAYPLSNPTLMVDATGGCGSIGSPRPITSPRLIGEECARSGFGRPWPQSGCYAGTPLIGGCTGGPPAIVSEACRQCCANNLPPGHTGGMLASCQTACETYHP